MSNLLLLARRRWRCAARSHLAAAIVAVAVMTAWLLYWGYLQYTGSSLSGRVLTPDFPADFAVTVPPGIHHSVPSSNAEMVQEYQVLTVETPVGLRTLGGISVSRPSAPLPNPKPGEIWLSEALRSPGRIDKGRPFQIAFLDEWNYRVFEGEVAGFYPAYKFCPEIVVESGWINEGGTIPGANVVTLYSWVPDATRWAGHLPKGATVRTAKTATELARKVVEEAYSGGGQGVGLLFIFLMLGVGTFNLLNYLDSRRELALLKSMGLRPRELGGLFILEGLFTGVLAFGFVLAVILAIDRISSLPLMFSLAIVGRAFALGAVAFAAATIIPYILAREASVNELLFGRPVPLLRRSVRAMRRNYPALMPLLDCGHQIVKLPIMDGGFPGICLCEVGRGVKAGETVAWEASAWGLIEHHYLAPCDGEVTQANLTQGLVVIKPH